MKKEKFHLEFLFERVTQPSLWRQLTSITGLSEWFADRVEIDEEGLYHFSWGKESHETARVLEMRDGESIRFRWAKELDPDAFFQFTIHNSELTGDRTLEITDYSYPDELDDMENLWNNQVEQLRSSLGV